MARTFIIQLLMLSLLLRSTSLWVALLVLGKQDETVRIIFKLGFNAQELLCTWQWF